MRFCILVIITQYYANFTDQYVLNMLFSFYFDEGEFWRNGKT